MSEANSFREVFRSALRIAILPFVFLLIVLSPVVWQRFKEWRTRERARQELQQFSEALDAYRDKYPDAFADPQ
jgi:hypothetical protein